MLADFAVPLNDGRIAAVVRDGLDPKAPLATRVAVTGMVLDRLFGRPVAVSETQPAGTQAYVELRSTVSTLPPGDRLEYLREQRMLAGIATPQPMLTQGEEEAGA